jgi:type I restriction enzyme, S subunit
MIPDGWKRKSLGEIADISSGSTPLRQKDEYWNEGTIHWVTTGEIDYQIIESAKEKITELALKECSLKIYDRGTILMAMYGQGITRGRIALLGINAATNQACCAISVDSSADTKFIYFQLEHLYQEIRKLGHGGNQQNLNGQIIKQIPIMFPPLLEQCRIAEVLGAWDESIDLLERLIGRVRSRKQGLMQQLLTGKKRFKEFEGSDYSIVKLSEVAKIRRGASPRPIQDPKWFAETGRGWVRIRDVTASDTYLLKTSQYLSSLAVEKSVKVDPGDLIMSICATIGVPRIVGIPACIHDGFVVFREFEKYIDKFFLYHYINLISAKISDSGQPGTQKNINTTIVGNIEVPKFSLPEQEKIAAVLSAADEEISTLEKQLAAYKQQKLGLMQQLLTGRIRI